MKRLILAALVLMFFIGAGYCSQVDLVKSTRNSSGVSCAEIPNLIREKLGFTSIAVSWIERHVDGITQVVLKVSAQKEVTYPESLTLAYSWNPEFVWDVRSPSQNVQPSNVLAKNWMEGKI